MTVIVPDYSSIQETLKGTSEDDLFIINSENYADKFLFGGAGFDTVSVPYSLDDYYSAVFYSDGSNQSSVLAKEAGIGSVYEYYGIFTDGIESIEFIDQTISLVGISEFETNWEGAELNYSDLANVVEGEYATINETLTSVDPSSAFTPGHGNATVIGSSAGSNKVFISAFVNTDEVVQNGALTTITADPKQFTSETYTISGRNIDNFVTYTTSASLQEAASSSWVEDGSIDLQNWPASPEPTPEPTPEPAPEPDDYELPTTKKTIKGTKKDDI